MSLLKRLTRRERPGGRERQASTIAPSPESLQWFLDRLQAVREPSVLDLGTGGERQLMSLVSLGYRVTADDTVASRLASLVLSPEEDVFAIADDPASRFRLELPDAAFDGVLAWSCFDRLSYLGGFLLGSELVRVVKPGGVVTGTWSGLPREMRRARSHAPSSRLVSGRVRPMRFHDPAPCRYEVGEIVDLFPGFKLVHSMVYVDGTRRALLEKTGGPATAPGKQA